MQAVFQLFCLGFHHGPGFGSIFSAQSGGMRQQLFGQFRLVFCKNFHRRGNSYTFGGIGAALCFDVIVGNRIDFVSPKFDTHGCRGTGAVKIDNAAAQAELARTFCLLGRAHNRKR